MPCLNNLLATTSQTLMFTFSHTYCNHLCYLTYLILNLLLNEQMSRLIAGVFDTNNILLKCLLHSVFRVSLTRLDLVQDRHAFGSNATHEQ